MDFELFERIIRDECEMHCPVRVPSWAQFNRGEAQVSYRPETFDNLAWRLLEVAKSAFVPRGYNGPYGLSDDKFFFESIGSHTNLVVAIATAALDFIYEENFGNSFALSHFMMQTIDGYSYREVIEVARLHDLAENETGDLPDHGERDEELKLETEFRYVEDYLGTYPESQKDFADKVLKLFGEMQMLSTPTGRLLYLSDKVAALIVTLALDREGYSPMILGDDPYLSERDVREIKSCDYSYEGRYKASEMWTVDFFEIRNMAYLDTDMFFTALIAATTLMVNDDTWYAWREMDYLIKKPKRVEIDA